MAAPIRRRTVDRRTRRARTGERGPPFSEQELRLDLTFSPQEVPQDFVGTPHKGDSLNSSTGSYTLGDCIGEGNFGKVFACHPSDGRRQSREEVIKIMRNDGIEAGLAFRTVLSTLLRSHDCPVLPKYSDIWVAEGRFFLRMEQLPGTTLADWMDVQELISELQVHTVAKQLFEAVRYIHFHNVVHRDVKPDNVFLMDTEQMRIKLFDFGCSSLIDAARPDCKDPPVTLAKRAQVGGFSYLAPEVLTKEYTQLVDVWSSGVLVYELFSGFCPYEFESLEEYRVLLTQRVDLRCDPFPVVDPPAVAFLRAVLEADPAKRPTALQALALDWLA